MRAWMFGVLLFAGFGFSGASAAAAAGSAIVGTWLTADGSSRVRIADVHGVYDGRVVWLEQPDGADGKPKVDRQNPDASLRGRSIMGLPVLTGLHYAGNNAWEGGTVYTPATGKSYPCKVALGSDGTLKLSVGGGVFGRTLTWTRAAGGERT